ncbi:hypothetical protein N7468_003508 [Penicillium chermesinum]|uniref:Nuclear distribution protein RO10 n=1 Tax=Penicillium chermesinum TaxID=63820 RepID=A0A9W9P6T6_9EURO|nr:uncharacterized protein N7468_003508 [Penicillium chermesinum]KAJ5238889.1 hypothetical protein N7468_003508 [Penicillium chermesinum]
MTQESDSVAGATIELLEARLRRIAYLLGGATDWTGVPTMPEKPSSHEESVSRRLARLEKELAKLSRNVPAVRDVIQLHDQFPDLFQAPTPEDVPEGLSSRALASIVLSYATAFPETASRLTSLNDLPIPTPRKEQAQAISELRVRTARVLQRWYEVGLVGSGECWAEWEGRIENVEREVRRREVIKARRENEI